MSIAARRTTPVVTNDMVKVSTSATVGSATVAVRQSHWAPPMAVVHAGFGVTATAGAAPTVVFSVVPGMRRKLVSAPGGDAAARVVGTEGAEVTAAIVTAVPSPSRNAMAARMWIVVICSVRVGAGAHGGA